MHAIQCVTASRNVLKAQSAKSTFAMERETPVQWQFALKALEMPKSSGVIKALRELSIFLKNKEMAGVTLSRRTRELNQEVVAVLRRH